MAAATCSRRATAAVLDSIYRRERQRMRGRERRKERRIKREEIGEGGAAVDRRGWVEGRRRLVVVHTVLDKEERDVRRQMGEGHRKEHRWLVIVHTALGK